MLTFRYRSTNCFFLRGRDGGLLAFDAGWPCSLFEYSRMMKTIGLRIEDLRWAMVSHMHMDHAGLLGEFIGRGVLCHAFEGQAASVESMERIILKSPEYRDYRRIRAEALIPVAFGKASALLAGLGIEAAILRTPGHSPDSVSLVTSSGEALVGDLAPPDQIMDDDAASHESWRLLRAAGGRIAYPSHAPVFAL